MRSAIAAAGKKFRTKNISQRVQKIVISPIKEMSILADHLEETIGNGRIISFGQGIPYFDTPAQIKSAIRKALTEKDTARYTLEPGITELRELIAKDVARRKGIKGIRPKKEVIVGVGTQELMNCAIASVIDPGDEILLPEPAYASHIEQIIQWGGRPRFVSLRQGAGWGLNVEDVRKKVNRRTKALLLTNPSNPTGLVFGKKEIVELSKLAKKKNLIVITDETYDFLLYDGVKHFSPATLPWMRDRVVLCGSFSKKYAMTGYRVGFAFAEEGLIDHMLKVHDALSVCAPAISQKAAMAALKGSLASVRHEVKELTKNRERMCRELDKMADVFEYRKPQGAYYILAKYKKWSKMSSFKLALKILNEAHVIVIPGAAFGPSGEGHLRFSFAGEPKKIKEGFERLRKWINKNTHRKSW